MDDAALVGVLDGPGQALKNLRRRRDGQRRTVDPLGQAATLQQFQRDVRGARVFADFIDLHNIGMLEAGNRAGLRAGAGGGRRRSAGGGAYGAGAICRNSRPVSYVGRGRSRRG